MLHILEQIIVILLWVFTFLVIFIILVQVTVQITFLYCVLKVSGILYYERCLLKFINKYQDYYLDINMMSGETIENVKLILNNYSHISTGVLEYKLSHNKIGAVLKGKVKNLSISNMYVDNYNWNNVKNKIKLPTDMIRYISEYVCDKNFYCDNIEKSDDKKYFDNI